MSDVPRTRSPPPADITHVLLRGAARPPESADEIPNENRQSKKARTDVKEEEATTSTRTPSSLTTLRKSPTSHDGISEPSDKDVILGRGGVVNKHVGNKRYREYASDMKDGYKNVITYKEKQSMSWVSNGGNWLRAKYNDD